MAVRMATVFGGSGFLGRYVVRALARSGARVTVAVRYPEGARFLRPMGEVGQIVPVAANIGDEASVAAAVGGSDAVVNLVGILYQRGRRTFEAVHVAGAERIARAAAAAGAERLVHVSAIGASPGSPAAYARSKAAGEAAVAAAFPAATIVRPSIVFGAEDDFFNRFAMLARLVPVLPLIGGGKTRFQPVYADDVAAGIAAILADPATAGQTYEFAGPRVYSFASLMSYILAQTGRRRLLVPVPRFLAMLPALFLEMSPFPPLLTRDQVRMLGRDNVPGGDLPGLAELGIAPTALETVVPSYLARYRRGGGLAYH